jgi:hypothetical protein
MIKTSGFWPRVHARTLRAPVFLSSLPRKTGRCAPTPPPCPSQLRCFSVDPQKYIKSIELEPPIVASLIRPAIFCGQNYVPVRPVFSFLYSSWIFSFCYSLLFSSLLFISFLSIFSYPSLLISSYSSRMYFSSSSYSSLLIPGI